ncbi:MAG TPA: hypothetical protein VGX24_08940 [Pyrinomonadaceae bacterium]|jgi:hypothetical protein|nr:hypothetical protein [Pyrinomonadaceae bacterium]
MQSLRKLFFVALATLALGCVFSSSQVAFAQAEDDVVVNEFVVNPTTGKEYIELLVTNPAGVNMQGWTISDVGTRAGATAATEGDVTLPAAAYLANVPQGTFVVIVLTTPAANTNTLVEDTSTTDGNRKLVLIIGTTTGLVTAGTIDNAASDNIQVYAGTRATGTLIDQTLAGTNTSYIAGATWGDNNGATTTDNINGSSGIPSNAAVRFVPTADTLAGYQDNDTGARFAVDAASYGTPGAPNTGVPGDASIFSAGGAPLIISEFRTFGPTGSCDEFIEIYNTSDSTYTVQSLSAGSSGFAVAQSNGNVLFTIPNGTLIPARGHYLAVNNGGGACTGAFSGSAYPAGNGTTATGNNTLNEDIPTNAGIAIFNTSLQGGFNATNRLDAVGTSAESNPLYVEGTGYPAFSPSLSGNPGVNFSIFRNAQSGVPLDTNNNETDFQTADINGTNLCSSTINFRCQRLGAPGPENLSSPTQRNAEIKASLVDTQCASISVNPTLPSACRLERRTGAGSGFGSSPTSTGTLSIRRRFTNNTTQNVTRLRFRIVDISTFPSALGTADLRAISSTQVTATCQSEGGTPHLCSDNPSPTTTIEGTTLETDASGQSNGGGLNSTLSLATPLAAGASINVQFLLGVEQNGTFRFFVNVEALTSAPAPTSTKAQATGKARAAKSNK